MNINYFMKVQNAYGTRNRRERELAKTNYQMVKHFEDTYDTDDVLLNGEPFELMIIKDTDGNTFKKKIKSPHDKRFNLGDYVIWNNQIWLITLLDPDNKTWNRGYMYLCTIPLRWQNSDGKIIERYAYSEDFTKYSSGTTRNNTITIGNNQYGLTLPIDSETRKLTRDMRLPIDFEDADKPDIYKLTNRKVNLNNNEYFSRGGTIILTMSYDAFNEHEDKRVAMDNGKEVWVCNYRDINANTSITPPSNPNETVDLSANITGITNLRIDTTRTYTATLSDADGNAVQWDDSLYGWNVVSDFDVHKTVTKNKISLTVEDEDFVNSSFILSVIKLDDNSILSEIGITVIDVM